MIHKTWNGVDIPICSMDDEHLMSMIKLQFKPYSNEKENELLSFMVGKTLPKMTVEVFNNIMVNKSLYIIEAMRRDSTRNTLIEFLGTFNPVYKTLQFQDRYGYLGSWKVPEI